MTEKPSTYDEAVEFDGAKSVGDLVALGFSPLEPDAEGGFALNKAASSLISSLVTELIALGADVSAADDIGFTPLLSVIEYSHWNEDKACFIIEELLSAGADIEGRGDWDKTPFLKSCTRGSKKVTQLLVDRGCNVHATADELGGPMGAEEMADVPWNNAEFRKYIADLINS